MYNQFEMDHIKITIDEIEDGNEDYFKETATRKNSRRPPICLQKSKKNPESGGGHQLTPKYNYELVQCK